MKQSTIESTIEEPICLCFLEFFLWADVIYFILKCNNKLPFRLCVRITIAMTGGM